MEVLIDSIIPRAKIEISGFEVADESVHMIEWLGRGSDFRRFVTQDVESELYRQTPGAQLLSMECTAEPEIVTAAEIAASNSIAKVTGIEVDFPLSLRVRTAEGDIWRLSVKHAYDATNIHLRGGARTLKLRFEVVNSIKE